MVGVRQRGERAQEICDSHALFKLSDLPTLVSLPYKGIARPQVAAQDFSILRNEFSHVSWFQ
jgi:hypothetical protein